MINQKLFMCTLQAPKVDGDKYSIGKTLYVKAPFLITAGYKALEYRDQHDEYTGYSLSYISEAGEFVE